MRDVAQQPSSWEHKIYGFLFIIIALLDLGLATTSAFPFDQHWLSLMIHLIGILGFLIVGVLVLRVRTPTMIVGLRIGTLIGLVAGTTLGILMAIAASGPNEAELGVALYALLPLPVLLLQVSNSVTSLGQLLLLLLPHILAILTFGGYAFWMGKHSRSAKDVLKSTLYVAFAIALFTLLAGGIYSLSLAIAGTIVSYGDWSELFIIPLGQLLLYALVIGSIAASLSRAGRT
jgi:hypothetical protein